MLKINARLSIPIDEIQLRSIRAQGSGGQNVNKVSSAIHLRFNVQVSSLPDAVKRRLLAIHDQRISTDGVIIIKAQNHRTREKNRTDAMARLAEMVKLATLVQRKRIPTRPGRAVKQKRLDNKKKRGALKKLRARDYDVKP